MATVVSAGQTITGAISLTVITNEQVVSFPAGSKARKEMVEVPMGKTLPLG